MTQSIVKVLETGYAKRRVLIVSRDDGLFGLVLQRWHRSEHEGKVYAEGWANLLKLNGIFQTVEIAEKEARADKWLNVI